MPSLKEEKIAKSLIFFGTTLLACSLILFLLIFYPVIKEEIKYDFSTNTSNYKVVTQETTPSGEAGDLGEKEMAPVDPEFSIVIPKTNANARIIQNVDPYNSKEYQQKLTKGVAQASGSALPEELGNTFLFAHSSDNFYNANRYNAVFYLLYKLDKGDDFYIARKGDLYHYQVTSKMTVEPNQVQYLTDNTEEQKATLMTCWPPGTTLKRLLVVGILKDIQKN
jgi:sortase A